MLRQEDVRRYEKNKVHRESYKIGVASGSKSWSWDSSLGARDMLQLPSTGTNPKSSWQGRGVMEHGQRARRQQ